MPASVIVLAAASLIGRNVYQGVLRPQASQASVLAVSRVLVLVIMAVALVFAIAYPTVIVNLLLTSYDGVTQFFPAVVLSMLWRRTSKTAVAGGILVGVGLVLYLVVSKHDPLWGLNAGIVALAANVVVTVLGSLAFPARRADDPLVGYKPFGRWAASLQSSGASAPGSGL